MYDYSRQIEQFRDSKVRLPKPLTDKLFAHRKANQDRLISRIGDHLAGASLGEGSFKPQGSVAMRTIIQTRFDDDEYDIDVGVIFRKDQLVDDGGEELSASCVRQGVLAALRDKRFSRQPVLKMNCIRVYYADQDAEKHHVDFPVYRRWKDEEGGQRRELASSEGWYESNPTQVNQWFDNLVAEKNREEAGWGTQFRHLVQLMKRFCRSRRMWEELLPNGMKLTMLVAECLPDYSARSDKAFRDLLNGLAERLAESKVILNLAHDEKPMITRGESDENVVALTEKVDEALKRLETLDGDDTSLDDARKVWDWVFKSDGFFEGLESKVEKSSMKAKSSPTVDKGRVLDVIWRQPPLWPVRAIYEAVLVGKLSRTGSGLGIGWCDFESGAPLSKGVDLRFICRTDASPPYQVYWQVVNTGDDARRAGCLRGGFVESSYRPLDWERSQKGAIKKEVTEYSGLHTVQCFIVQGNVCVSQSDVFYVRVK